MKVLLFCQLTITLFSAILFLQSGFDKVFDLKGNLGYIRSVFEKTPLKSVSSMLFYTITVLEVATGIVSLIGAFMLFTKNDAQFAIWGLELATISILCLFLGQRVAKDYGGAASLVGYFLVLVFGLFLMI